MILEKIFVGSLIFNSLPFLIFFPIVILLYFSISHKYRWILLLIFSYYFYMSWKAEYGILLAVSTLVDYFAGRGMEKFKKKVIRKSILAFSLTSNLGLLFTFKYFNFVSESTRQVLSLFSMSFSQPVLNVILPVGISFYTFQTMSYTIDVYREKIKAEKHLGIFAVYVSYFPQLVAGPIERASNLLPQFRKKHYFNNALASDGLKLMLWGFFKKIVIADRLAILVDAVYSNPYAYDGGPLILATFFFAIQIYCDFSGYSDIAIGASQIMGIRLMDNFRRPYYSKSISEFWKRWHISLSTWFRDYLYIPLGGNKTKTKTKWYFNLFVVFLISGLWHGAAWTFVIWGALHGSYLILGIITFNMREKFKKKIKLFNNKLFANSLSLAITFLLVCFAWIFFRANSVSDAIYIITHLTSNLTNRFSGSNLELDGLEIVIGIVAIMFMEIVHLIQEHKGMRHFLSKRPAWLRWIIYMVIILFILLFGIFTTKQFIYFQF